MTGEIKIWHPKAWPLLANERCARIERLRYSLRCREELCSGELVATDEMDGRLYLHQCSNCRQVYAVPEKYPRFEDYAVECDHPGQQAARNAQRFGAHMAAALAYESTFIGKRGGGQ